MGHDFNLLFVASSDHRNTIKTIVGLPEGYEGECTAVLNDMSLIIMARNAIMLFTALQFESEIAVSVIILLVLGPSSFMYDASDAVQQDGLLDGPKRPVYTMAGVR
jgi:hypothetical protein